ncbi:hypothetical protein HETIRDRAFT_54938 [Heterobasidion irregulare TC 32-1]|uniref:Uncharacterized protein n=1 Tax=Heterobasidion irregulare (strain TC 32-1) TaxID=747525 RepID=W4KAT3_HETIT|nr:uncharacterized protein HETIRDRAFT_54938 [Heterobasidion irregulare TC 32-1]ETW82829.1 hypothetical protein HETIRDRAFT_54938 [Heterobasidion irregulare TC 32-1]
MYLIGIQNLIVKVDACYIKGMLTNPDLKPSASINQCIISILTFYFILVHVPGTSHSPNGLSQCHNPSIGLNLKTTLTTGSIISIASSIRSTTHFPLPTQM